MLCSQVLNAAVLYSEQIAEELDSDEIGTVKATIKRGQRDQDKKNLEKQVENEDTKALCNRTEKLDLKRVTEIAMNTKPTNNATFTFDEDVLLWLEKVKEMCKVK